MSKAQVFAATTNQIKKPLITTIPYPSTFHPTYQNSPPLKLSMKSPDRNPSHWLSEHQGSDMAQSPRNGVKEGRKEGGKEAQILFHHQPNINNDITPSLNHTHPSPRSVIKPSPSSEPQRSPPPEKLSLPPGNSRTCETLRHPQLNCRCLKHPQH